MSTDTLPFKSKRSDNEEVHWLSISDLMSGLMMIFLFLAVNYMLIVVAERDNVIIERNKIKNIIVAWDQTQEAVYKALEREFRDDLKRWNAEIERQTLTVRFREPEVLFKINETSLSDRFKNILVNFFPRYIKTLDQFSDCSIQSGGSPRGCIEEIRIEGHTSSEWNSEVSEIEAYFNNMLLSQGRTRSVLRFCYSLPRLDQYTWLRERIAAVGYSSSHLIYDAYGNEDVIKSRRVEFRVKTTVEEQLMRVINAN